MYQKMVFAIMNGDIIPIQEFIKSDKNNVNIKDKMGRTLLMEAAIFKKEDIARTLIENGADINVQDNKGWTALHFSIQSFLPDLVKLLICKGANVNAKDDYDNTPLHKALNSSQGRGDIILQLLKAGADKNIANKSGRTPYQVAKEVTNFNLKQYFE
jgi:uncharacterized protein